MGGTTEMLARLVAFPTVSRDPNDALIAYAAAELTGLGFRVRVLPGRQPGKSNLLASLGPDNGHGVILSGHSDVVPVDGQDWSTDPFTLSRRDGTLRARGAVDMKGFIASMLNAAAGVRGAALQRPLHLALSHDEEVGCIGVRTMLETLAAEGFAAAGCIIGEPTDLHVGLGHKGKLAGCVRCRGQAAHSADPDLGCNAIYLAAGMVAELLALQDWLRAHGAHDAAYAVPYSTLHIGTIAGGQVLNIVPDRCDMKFEIRYLPGDDPLAVLDRLREAGDRLAQAERDRGRQASVEIGIDNEYPGLATPADAWIAGLAAAAANTGPVKLNFGTEGGLFTATAGIPTVICGPGSIDRAHKPDEYITLAELDACDAFLGRIVTSLTVP